MTDFLAAAAAGPAITSTDSKSEVEYSSCHRSEAGFSAPVESSDRSRKTASFGLAATEVMLSETD
jgi:hypothetical protein